jgi:hypothetical protein
MGEYRKIWYPARSSVRHFTTTDLKRIYKYVKQNPSTDNDLLLGVLFELIFDLMPTFRHWMCLWLKMQQVFIALGVTYGIVKLVSKLIKFAKMLNEVVVLGFLNKFMKQFGIIAAFVLAIIAILEGIVQFFEFLTDKDFGFDTRDVLKLVVCDDTDTSILESALNAAASAAAQQATTELFDMMTGTDTIIIDNPFPDA